MFSQGLSLDQAPPISVPFRFFLTAPFFGLLIGIVFLIYPFNELSDQYTYLAIGVVHLFTLGILSMIIFGAMQQMMPVLAGAIIKKPELFANIVHPTLTLGSLFLSFSFILNIKLLLHIGVLFLGISFLTFFIFTIKLLFKVEFLTSTVKAMRLFSLSGFITLCLGFYIAFAHMSNNITETHYSFVNMHILFGLFGFAIILIMGVAFQVIPMFYVAQNFPKFIQEKIPLILFCLLLISTYFLYKEFNFLLFKLLFIGIFICFSFYGIKSLNNRKRPVFDVTLWYWKLSLGSLVLSMLIWFLNPFVTNYVLGVIFAFGFLYSLLQGMIYKIIPFLAWFHLNSKGYFMIPTIREFIDEKYIRIHFYIHCISMIFFLLAYFIEFFIYIASVLFIVSNIVFLINQISAIKKYKEILKTDPMDMGAFK